MFNVRNYKWRIAYYNEGETFEDKNVVMRIIEKIEFVNK
jgi:hypothetical protein